MCIRDSFDRDDRVDLTASPADAIGSVANFLVAHGWERNAPIADVVAVSGEGIQALIDEGIMPRLTPQQMAAARADISIVMSPPGTGTVPQKVGAGDTAFPDRPAALIDLVTPGAATEYRLGYGNFYVITRYNLSLIHISEPTRPY